MIHALRETSALMVQHPILVARARDSRGHRFAEDADDGGHLREHFGFGEVSAGAFILDRELPEGRLLSAIDLEHFPAMGERNAQVFPRRHGKDGGETFHRNRRQIGGIDEGGMFDLPELLGAGFVSDDLIRLEDRRSAPG